MPETAFFFNDAPIPNNALCSLGPQNLLSEFTVRTTDTAVARQCLPPSELSPLDAGGQTTAAVSQLRES